MKLSKRSLIPAVAALMASGFVLSAAVPQALAANPCAPKAENPCAPKKADNPCAPKGANPCAPKAGNPCAPKK